jgi:ATP-dependent Zn protease
MATRSEKIAYHEAGHAVVARALGVGVVVVTMYPTHLNDGVAGAVTTSAAYRSQKAGDGAMAFAAACEDDAIVSLAGPASQVEFFPNTDCKRAHRGDWSNDWETAQGFLRRVVVVRKEGKVFQGDYCPDDGDRAQVYALWEQLASRASDMVKANRGAIERVAKALLSRGCMDQDELDALIASEGGAS